ncbi:septum site-determining protein MinC [Legionella yabuuchiae]|uniref:septum site-determining protein MinC n=1 Tax=Legionella yabuuchiae TaxID=376727 RepID=UPI001054BDCE|nr:septum site-determining protein MinC [Legionella yabuuchiae]
MNDNALKTQAFKLKGRLYTLTVLSLVSSEVKLFAEQLSEVVAQAPNLFKNIPVILDCSHLNGAPLDIQAICQCAREKGLVPVAVQGGNPMLETLAQVQGLAVMNASSSHDKPIMNAPVSPKANKKPQIVNKMITVPVRSGQQMVSKGDLIITAAVSNGAELLSDGNIHVYGALRGRALAGINGNKQARIFCQSLEAELVSIAGFYRLSDAIKPISGPCQIYLQDDQIQIEPV